MGNRVYTLTKKNVQNRIKSIIFPYTSKKTIQNEIKKSIYNSIEKNKILGKI